MSLPARILSTVRPARTTRRFHLPALLMSLGLLLLTGSAASADLTLNLDVKNGDKVGDVVALVAHVDSDADIDKVEFRLDDQPPITVTSVPYKFSWDTIKDTEGPHTLVVTAYDSKQRTRKVTVSLIVDNELNLGAPALAQKAQDALAAKDYDTARRYARRTLKAEPGSLAATRVLARIAAANEDWDSAISTLEAAKDLDKTPDAVLELAAYRMRRALRPENATQFFPDFEKVVALRHTAMDVEVAAAKARHQPGAGGKATVQGHEEIGDALMNAGRFAEANAEYAKIGEETDSPPISSVSRLALSEVMIGKSGEAITRLRLLERAKTSDAASRAVYALALLYERRFAEARAIIAPEDLAARVPAALIAAAYADTVLQKRREALSEARVAVNRLPNAAEAHYALSMATIDRDVSEQELQQALSLNPFQNGPLLVFATHLAQRGKPVYYEEALNIADFALNADPADISVRLMRAMLFLQTGRMSEAETILKELILRDKTEADVVMALSVYWNVKDNGAMTARYMQDASRLDPERFTWTLAKTPIRFLEAVNLGLYYRAGFFLTPSTLFPAKSGTSGTP